MKYSIYDKVVHALKQAENHNSNLMVKPEVILWPDPENQWCDVIEVLQKGIPHLLIYGNFEPSKKQGPAIWLKCMIAKVLPEANWNEEAIPIIYLPGIAKSDLRNVENAVFNFQPLLEYQYTGTLFMQDNGREWSILAFIENPINGLGIKVAKDNATKDALKKTLPSIFQDKEVLANKTVIDADYLNNQLFPDIIPSILKWMCKGDSFLNKTDAGKIETFNNLCKSQYEFEPDHKNIKAIAEKLGSQKNSWKYVWQLYANAPHKYPEIEGLLRLAKPADLGIGVFALPDESWPQVNELKEEALAQALSKAAKQDAVKALATLQDLEKEHSVRRNWVWFELGKSPMANALHYLVQMAAKANEAFSSSSIEAIKNYYTTHGFSVDQFMRKALAAVKSEKDKTIVKSIIHLFYQPWLENITKKFQKLVEQDANIFTSQKAVSEIESFVLFVDAFRYELAEEFCKRLTKYKLKVSLQASWSAIPSLTPTAKPNVSPIANAVSIKSGITEFRPQLQNGKDLLTPVFRDALKTADFKLVTNANDIQSEGKYWKEIGDIDTKGHEEQADMVKRIEELFDQVEEALEVAFERGIKRIKIVTDHGWLLLPGGLPKTQLNAGLTETRWGRCALIKEGATTDLLHLPWRWNPSIYIAYAPGISFFKANEEYAHGGISLHECLVPTITIENPHEKNIEAEIKAVKWINLKCAIHTTVVPDSYSIDIRTKYNEKSTSIVLSKTKQLYQNEVTLMVDDDAEYKAATIVLVDENGRILDKKPTTVGG
ncbi:BREX-1 system phosphatase PglZ type B [Sediminibacterium sp.]|uniref:BREX-1 system phosphatase PglZ type B n=1 Tax=Sediminibacterium sp. TaxID=1917865 RepID=UPI003F710926